MRERIQTETDGKTVTLYRHAEDGAPTVYANLYADTGEALFTQCERLGCQPFHLAAVTGLRWDEELSPWAHDPVVSRNDRFTGEADAYVRCLEEKVVPMVEERLPLSTYRVLAGYSMGGLFALYAPYVTELFSASVAASGSVWYPGFLDYAKARDFRRKPDAVYLSLGDLESRTRNPWFRRTEPCMRELRAVYQSKAIETVFELNPGNHAKDATARLAKGIAWALEHRGGRPAALE